MCACYSYRWEYVLEMESHTFLILHQRMTLSEYRRHYSIASLTATLLNALGGKSDGGASIPASKRFEPEELLPPWAQPAALTRDLPFTPQQCAAISESIAAKELPSWAVQMIDQIMPVAKIERFGGKQQHAKQGDWDGLKP